MSLESAATLPDNFVTAFYTLFNQLSLAWPKSLSDVKEQAEPVLIYGAASSAGLYLVQLLRIAGFANIYAVASARNHAYLVSLGATHVFAYSDMPRMVQSILDANGGKKVKKVVDCISGEDTIAALATSLLDEEHGELAVLLPIKEGNSVRSTAKMGWEVNNEIFPKNGAKWIGVKTFMFQQVRFSFGYLVARLGLLFSCRMNTSRLIFFLKYFLSCWRGV